jgi:hypothetical protein
LELGTTLGVGVALSFAAEPGGAAGGGEGDGGGEGRDGVLAAGDEGIEVATVVAARVVRVPVLSSCPGGQRHDQRAVQAQPSSSRSGPGSSPSVSR